MYRNYVLAICNQKKTVKIHSKIILCISGPPGKRGKRGRRGESGKSLFQLPRVIQVLGRLPHLCLLINNNTFLLEVVWGFKPSALHLEFFYVLFLSVKLEAANVCKVLFLSGTTDTQIWPSCCVKSWWPFRCTEEAFSAGLQASGSVGGQGMQVFLKNTSALAYQGTYFKKFCSYLVQLVQFCHALTLFPFKR